MNLNGKVALVTGGAHRLGKVIALALAQAGADVVIHFGRSAEQAQSTKAEIEAIGVKAITLSANLADPGEIEVLFAAVEAQMGHLNVLVNSAASFQSQAFEEVTVDDWDRVLAVNLRAPFLCSQHAARLMRKGKEQGLIVNLIDLSGVYPWKDHVQHGVSKAGLRHLTKIAARSLAPHVRVNALTLGAILPPAGVSAESPGWKNLEASLPLQRAVDPQEVGRVVVSLAESTFITGAEVLLTGGEHLLGPVNH